MADDDLLYEVGHGKPPKSGQFQQGKSGNPKGRPKGSKGLASIVLRESRETLVLKGPHGNRKVTKLEAAIMQLGNKAAQGEFRSQKELFSLVRTSEESTDLDAASFKLREADQKVLQSIRRRMQSFQPNSEESKEDQK